MWKPNGGHCIHPETRFELCCRGEAKDWENKKWVAQDMKEGKEVGFSVCVCVDDTTDS